MWSNEIWNFFIAAVIAVGVIIGVAMSALIIALYWWLV